MNRDRLFDEMGGIRDAYILSAAANPLRRLFCPAVRRKCKIVAFAKRTNWNLRGCPRRQCVRGRFIIATPLDVHYCMIATGNH